MVMSPIIYSFSKGEWDNKKDSRVEIEGFSASGRFMENCVISDEGGAFKRPGTSYLLESNVEYSGSRLKSRLVNFSVAGENYIIEIFNANFIAGYWKGSFRVIKNGVVIYTELDTAGMRTIDVDTLRWVQVGNSLFFVAKNTEPFYITRVSDTVWDNALITFSDGPYQQTNTTSTTLIASSSTGIATITASASIFTADMVGRHIRMQGSSGRVWAWLKIVTFTSGTQVSATIIGSVLASTATTLWAFGSYYGKSASDLSFAAVQPESIDVFENRLVLGGGPDEPNKVSLSMTNALTTFSPSEPVSGSVLDTSGIAAYLISKKADNVVSIGSTIFGLGVQTTGGDYIIRASNDGSALTANNYSVRKSNSWSAANIPNEMIDGSILYVQEDTLKIRRLTYDANTGTFISQDLNSFNNIITYPGIKRVVYQPYPFSILWALKTDGTMISLSHNESTGTLGWTRHNFGYVEDVCVSGSELYFMVKRTINSIEKHYIEKLNKFYNEFDDRKTMVYVDSAISGTNAIPTATITGLGHLEGETLKVWTDGAIQPDVVVASGSVTLQNTATKYVLGLPYTMGLTTNNAIENSALGTGQSKKKRINNIVLRLYNSLGGKVGTVSTKLDTLFFREPGMVMDSAPPLFTGDKTITPNSDFDKWGRIYITHDTPTSFNLLGIIYKMEVTENT